MRVLRKKYPRLPTKIVSWFVRTWIFIRLRRTNRRGKEIAQQKRENENV